MTLHADARCMLAFSLWIGNHYMAADHGARSRGDVLELAMRRLKAEPGGGATECGPDADKSPLAHVLHH